MGKNKLVLLVLGLFLMVESSWATLQEPVRIACVGNSITYGYKVANRERNSYPAQLQALLGTSYEVRNFGVSGRTLLQKGDLPYIETDAYANALEFNPDIVFIKLGTNDSKLQNREHLADFENDYTQLIHSFKEVNKDARIVLLLPVPAFTADITGIWNEVIKNKIVPLTQAVAYGTASEVIDLYQLFIDQPNLLPDTVHPSSLGATVIANRLYETVMLQKSQAIELFNSDQIKNRETQNFYGYRQTNFEYKGIPSKVVQPKRTAVGKPWVLRARFWGHEPQTDIALLERGFHIAYCDVADLYGSSKALERWDDFYRFMTQAGLSKKVVLEGMSRGGLISYNWAEKNPKKIACVYADAPVLDVKSWPGGFGKGKGSSADWEALKKVYGLKTEKNVTDFIADPIHKVKSIAKGGYPMLHVCGAADEVVPFDENTKVFAEGIKAHGGAIEVIYKEGIGHHPHSLENATPMVDFILRATNQKVNFATIPAPSAEYRSAAGWTVGKDWWAQSQDIDSLCKVNKEIDVLLIGNSITQGWGGTRPNVTYAPGKEAATVYLKDLNWIGAGISGDRTQHILYRIKKGNYEAANPKVIVLAIGVNNFGSNTASEIADGIKEVVQAIEEKFSPTTRIMLFGPLPTGIEPNTPRREKYDHIHAQIKKLGKQRNIAYYNLLDTFSDDKGFLKTAYYSNDGIHLLPEGYKVWGEFIYDNSFLNH
ncbi:Lysophospholipase L1 [Arenibacter nanhaiticus]|uniref:Lysophospholipase L1 n=1 Tax=Arenibacter nanhaiticus TaxID=558155 RepID=A0A1M6ITL5_9FLAO|nr:GDSL-type esterase/lipase family protein [Arenibacter nanhaiticus]SHJ37757.1 Lysophospholipase L1 [Arenibacter nanhaiticus]